MSRILLVTVLVSVTLATRASEEPAQSIAQLQQSGVRAFEKGDLRNSHVLRRESSWALVKAMNESAGEMLAPRTFTFLRTNRRVAPDGPFMKLASRAWAPTPGSPFSTSSSRTRDVKNLFVMDGLGFVSTACQNLTLTIVALAGCSCDYLMQEMKRGNV